MVRTLVAYILRVLLSPFWAGATHVVQLGPIWIEQRTREPAPAPRGHTDDAAESRGANNSLETYDSGNVLILKLLDVAAFYPVSTAAFSSSTGPTEHRGTC
jgi:hypothetical protein